MSEVVEEQSVFSGVIKSLLNLSSHLSNPPTIEDKKRQIAQSKIDLSVHTMD